MPDWAVTLVVAFLSTLSGAGGVVAYLRMRTDARTAAAARQDDYTLKLRDALDKDEAEFRTAVYNAYLAEVTRNRDLDGRLTETQKQLLVITGERDSFKRQLEQAQTDLSAAHTKIRHLESEIAQLQAHNQKEHT